MLTIACAATPRAWAAATATSTVLTAASGGNPLTSGASVSSGSVVTFTAAVTAGSTSVTTGAVTLCDATAKFCTDIHQLATAQLIHSGPRAGAATFNFIPGIGSHSYKAVFAATPNGAVNAAASTSSTISITVTGQFPTKATLDNQGNPGNYSLYTYISAYVNRSSLTVPGTVSFLDTSNGNYVAGTASVVTGATTLSFPGVPNVITYSQQGVVATADFNGDGIPDVVVANATSALTDGKLTVFLGNKDGSLSEVSTRPTVGLTPSFLAVGDFNSDGIPDLAVMVSGPNAVSILLGNGDGTFTAQSATLATPNSAAQLAVADLNGDGIQDLVLEGNNSLLIFLGQGDGTFKAVASSPATGQSPAGISVGDFNGDGIPDFGVANLNDGVVTILLGNGDGTFTPAAVDPAIGIGTISVQAADFNGDGKLDLAVTFANMMYPTNLLVLLGNGDGTFQFAPPQVGPTPFGIALGDFNQDGIPDLILASEPEGIVYLGNGDGTFTLSANVAPGQVAIADFNGDGLPDAVEPYPDATTQAQVLPALLTQTATAIANNISLLGSGLHNVIGSYSGGSLYAPATSSAVLLTANRQAQPVVTVTPASSSLTTAQSLAVTISVTDGAGNPVPTGTVKLASGSYASVAKSLSSGSAVITIPAGTLALGSDTLTATYSGDANYTTATGTAVVSVANPKVQPTVTVTPASPSITTAQSLAVTVSVSGGASNPAPTGSVTLTSGSYSSPPASLSNGSATINIPAGSLVTGSDKLTATYSGDTNYTVATGAASVSVAVAKVQPTVTVAPASASTTTAQSLAVTISVSDGAGNPVPTGNVTLASGSYTSAAVHLSNGSATISVPAGSLAVGSDTLTASYSGDANYTTATGTAPITVTTVAQATPPITVTPASSSISTAQALAVTVTVGSATTVPTPTGSITLTSGSYTSAAVTLKAGSASIDISAGSLSAGSDTLTAAYSGDSNYLMGTGIASVTVTNPSFTLSGSAVKVTAGAATGNASTITVTPVGGFTGNVTLTAALTSSPAGAVNPPTFSFGATNSVSLTTAAAASATLTITTLAPVSPSCNTSAIRPGGTLLLTTGGAVLACAMLFGIPARRRRWRSVFGLLILLAVFSGAISACGGRSKSIACPNVIKPGTTPGNYTITVTGAAGSSMASGPIALTVQ